MPAQENPTQNTIPQSSFGVNENQDLPSEQNSSSKTKSFKKAAIALLTLAVLLGGIGAGVFLVKQQQEIRERASSASECTHHPNCVVLDNPGNDGFREVDRFIERAIITNKPEGEVTFTQGESNNGCYEVKIENNKIQWEKVGSGSECRDVSNIQVWMRPEGRVSPIPCSLPGGQNKIVVNFNEKVLKANRSEGDAKTGPFDINLPVGNYKVVLESYDNHSDKPDQSQTQEQWFLSLLSRDASEITRTNSIGDLPENQDYLKEEVNATLEVLANITSVTATHTAYKNNNVNSIVPVCASFESITEIPTPFPTTTIVPTPTIPPITPTLPPQISAVCNEVKIYDIDWNLLTSSELSDLNTGDVIKFAVSGTTNDGSFDKARFSINGAGPLETSTKRTGTEEYYIEYTIPSGVVDFGVSVQVHHSSLDWI